MTISHTVLTFVYILYTNSIDVKSQINQTYSCTLPADKHWWWPLLARVRYPARGQHCLHRLHTRRAHWLLALKGKQLMSNVIMTPQMPGVNFKSWYSLQFTECFVYWAAFRGVQYHWVSYWCVSINTSCWYTKFDKCKTRQTTRHNLCIQAA